MADGRRETNPVETFGVQWEEFRGMDLVIVFFLFIDARFPFLA